jgi:hypothetical protein
MAQDAAKKAPPAIRAAVDSAGLTELRAWWAANAGAPYLPHPSTVQAAMASMFQLEPETVAPCPQRLPPQQRISELLELVKTLNTVRH